MKIYWYIPQYTKHLISYLHYCICNQNSHPSLLRTMNYWRWMQAVYQLCAPTLGQSEQENCQPVLDGANTREQGSESRRKQRGRDKWQRLRSRVTSPRAGTWGPGQGRQLGPPHSPAARGRAGAHQLLGGLLTDSTKWKSNFS